MPELSYREAVRDALGRQKVFHEAALRTAVPGVATGLSVTGAGGDVLFIEATSMKGKDGLVHRVLPGNFVGQNDGRIVGIASTKISIIEIVPDGLGGYIERPAGLALTE